MDKERNERRLHLVYAGIHQPSMARQLPSCMLSVNRLLGRSSNFHPHDWILDSGAFSRIASGRQNLTLREYALRPTSCRCSRASARRSMSGTPQSSPPTCRRPAGPAWGRCADGREAPRQSPGGRAPSLRSRPTSGSMASVSKPPRWRPQCGAAVPLGGLHGVELRRLPDGEHNSPTSCREWLRRVESIRPQRAQRDVRNSEKMRTVEQRTNLGGQPEYTEPEGGL